MAKASRWVRWKANGAAFTCAHGIDRMRSAGADAADHLFDLASGLLGAMGEGAYFVGYHREATPGFACPRRLDRGVQGQ